MPATFASVNLLGQDDFTHSPIGKGVTWATTYGRYIMVGTELVVLLAFISRFSLDRKLTDLKETIAQKQAIIGANLPFENEIRSVQLTTKNVALLLNGQSIGLTALTTIQGLLPPDVSIENMETSKETLKISAISGTVESFSLFLTNLRLNKQFTDVALTGSIKKDPITGIEFQVEMKLPAAQQPVENLEVPTSQAPKKSTSEE